MEKKHKIAIVNFITASRIIGTLLLPLIFSLANPLITILSVIGLYLTDLIDGQLAKNIWHVSTLGGAVLDAISDKILNFAILIYASLVCPPMISLLITEIVIGLNNIYGTLKGADIKSCLTGKIKMFILGVTIAATFIPSISKTLLYALTFLCLSTQILALGEYNDVIKKKVITNSSKKVNLKEIFSKLKSKKEIKEILFNPEYYEKNFDKTLYEHFTKEKVSNTSKENSKVNKDEESLSEEQKNHLKINYNLNDIDINKIEEYIKANNININELLTSLNNYYESFKTFNGPTQPVMELIKTKTLNISHKK